MDVHRREMFCRRRYVAAQRTDRSLRWKMDRIHSSRHLYRIYSSHEPRRDVFDVAFRACQLSGKEEPGLALRGHGFRQGLWRIDVRVPVNLAQAKELCILKSR